MRKAASPPRWAPETRPRPTRRTRLRPATDSATRAPSEVLVEEGPGYVRELMAWGAAFPLRARWHAGSGNRGRAQRASRPARARRDRARDWPGCSGVAPRPSPNVPRPLTHARVVELVTDGEKEEGEGVRCAGARILHEDGTTTIARSPVALRDRRCGTRVTAIRPTPWLPRAMAWRWPTGQAPRFPDLEFVQFHPTALKVPGQPRFLLSEALRGEGARLLNAERRGLHGCADDPAGDLAPRDRVARSMELETTAQLGAGGPLARASGPRLRARAVSL